MNENDWPRIIKNKMWTTQWQSRRGKGARTGRIPPRTIVRQINSTIMSCYYWITLPLATTFRFRCFLLLPFSYRNYITAMTMMVTTIILNEIYANKYNTDNNKLQAWWLFHFVNSFVSLARSLTLRVYVCVSRSLCNLVVDNASCSYCCCCFCCWCFIIIGLA